MNSVGEIKIRNLRSSDLPSVVKILTDTEEFRGLTGSDVKRILYRRFTYGKWVNRIQRCLQHGSLKFLFTDSYDWIAFVAEEEYRNKVVGVITAYPLMDGVWLAHQLVVLPNYRRRGIGYQLGKKLISHLKSNGEAELRAYFARDNIASINLCTTKFGFTVVKRPIFMKLNLRNTQ